MDDTTRGLGDRDEFAGRGDETVRNSAATEATPSTPAAEPRVTRTRSSKAASQAAAPTPRGRADTPADPDLDPQTDRRTREIQQEIAETREEMSETIDALQEKLRPANMVAAATERVKTATTEKVKHMAETASGTAQELLRDTREGAYGIVEGARQNPIPALMIGAGVAWLLMDQGKRRGDGTVRRDETWRASGTRYRTYGNQPDVRNSTRPAYGYGDYDTSTAYPTTGSETGPGIAERARETINEARYATERTTRRAQNQLQRLMRNNPLLVGAAAMVVGAAVGAALPETERENELMGDARDSVVDRAQEMAQNAVETVQDVARDATKEVVNRVAGTD